MKELRIPNRKKIFLNFSAIFNMLTLFESVHLFIGVLQIKRKIIFMANNLSKSGELFENTIFYSYDKCFTILKMNLSALNPVQCPTLTTLIRILYKYSVYDNNSIHLFPYPNMFSARSR